MGASVCGCMQVRVCVGVGSAGLLGKAVDGGVGD